MKSLLDNRYINNKLIYSVGDFNLNALDYENNSKVKDVFDLFFTHNHLPLINKPTRITSHNATIIDHIVTNDCVNNVLNVGILASDISDYFPIFVFSEKTKIESSEQKLYEHEKRDINNTSISQFQSLLTTQDWTFLYHLADANEGYNHFLRIFKSITIRQILSKTEN